MNRGNGRSVRRQVRLPGETRSRGTTVCHRLVVDGKIWCLEFGGIWTTHF